MGDVESAIALAGARLDEMAVRGEVDTEQGRCANRGRNLAFVGLIQRVCSEVSGPPVRRGDETLVEDQSGQLVPVVGLSCQGCDTYSIYDDERGAAIVAEAVAGNYVAHNVLCSIAAGFVAAGSPMPPHLREYIVAELEWQTVDDSRRPRGPHPYANFARDFIIANAVFEVASEDGFLPTRNRASDHESACSIVAQALAQRGIALSERAVEAIWAKQSAIFYDEPGADEPVS